MHLSQSKVLVLPTHVFGIQTHRAVHALGLFDVRTSSPLGRLMYSGLESKGDPIMRPTPKDLAWKYGVELHQRFLGYEDGRIRFADGTELAANDLTVIWCTGFRPDYGFVGVNDREAVFHPSGYPKHDRGVVRSVPGLYFVGLRYQHTVASHDIYGVSKDAEYIAERIGYQLRESKQGNLLVDEPGDLPLQLVVADCCVCGPALSDPVGSGPDYEYRTSPDRFHAHRCRDCGTVFLNPRPDVSEFTRIYPPSYHSLAFTDRNYSLVHRVRSQLEAKRLLRYCRAVPEDAAILDVGCGDGFHLRLLREYGGAGWRVEGVDIDRRAVERAASDGLTIHEGTIEGLDLPANHYDVVYAIQTIEHVADPRGMLGAIYRVLKPGGRLVLVTDNTGSVDFGLFRRSYWGGYHFPRHWYLFNGRALARLAHRVGFETEKLDTIVSPVNWVYSIHNSLVDRKAPDWLIRRFTLKAPVTLGVFTILDIVLRSFGRGALLNAYFVKPVAPVRAPT